MKIAFTGHTNIEKCCKSILINSGNTTNLKDYDLINDGEVYNTKAWNMVYDHLEKFIKMLIEKYGKISIISGGARGIDEIVANVALNLDLDLYLFIPGSDSWYLNREKSRGIRAQSIDLYRLFNYKKCIKYNIYKTYCNKTYKFVNFARNQAMVDNCHIMYSYKIYDSTGTDNAIKLASEQEKYGGNVPQILNLI